MTHDERDNPGITVPPPLIYLGPLLLGLLLNRKFPASFLPRGMSRVVGWPLLGGGVFLVGWFYRTMWRADTTLRTDKPASSLVTDGPYRYTRNPGYLSLAMLYAGIASLANALWAVLLLPAALFAVRRGVIDREERYLEREFGEEYLRYKARVRRWL